MIAPLPFEVTSFFLQIQKKNVMFLAMNEERFEQAWVAFAP